MLLQRPGAFLILILASLAAAPHAAAATAPATAPAAAPDAFDIERYLSIRSALSAGIAPDGSTIAFLTNVTGSHQIWTVPAGGGWPDQITFYADEIGEAKWSPRGDWIAFSKDRGGDENYQIHLVSPDGSRTIDLTAAPAVRHNLGSWSRDGRFLSYSSNARNPAAFDLYVLEIATRQARLVLQRDERLYAGPFSRDGRRIVASRSNGSLDNDLLLVDLESAGTEEPVLLTPHQGRARFDPVDWAADGRSLWILSDAGREFAALARLDTATKAISWAREPQWDVTSASLSPDGKTLAMVVNEDGYDSLHLVDAATLRDRPVPGMIRGRIEGPEFSRDGRRLALTVASPTRNANVWLLDRADGAARQVTRASTAGIPPSSFVDPRPVRYRSFDNLEIPAFYYLPASAGPGQPVRCIVYPHGGPEGQTTARFSPVVQYYVNRGYAILAPNVRGSTGYGRTFTHLDDVRKREDSVKDLAAAVDWLASTGRVDPGRIAVMGGSYGGYMTLAAVTLFPDLWAAAVDSFGIANFRTFLGKTAAYRMRHRASEYGDPEGDAEFLDSISPIHRVDRIKAPLLVLQGANDPRVPPQESEQIVAAIRQRGGAVEYILFPDEGHGWAKLANQIAAHRATADFLDRYLSGPAR